MKYVATIGDQTRVVDVSGADGRYRVTVADELWDVDARLTAQGIYSLLIDGVSYVADVVDRDGACVVDVGGELYEITVEEQTRHIIRTRAATPNPRRTPANSPPTAPVATARLPGRRPGWATGSSSGTRPPASSCFTTLRTTPARRSPARAVTSARTSPPPWRLAPAATATTTQRS